MNEVNKILFNDEIASFDKVTIKIASPETIRSWSHGEVKNPETINYRTFKPEKNGLFCEKIFGPTRDWECNCGKYKRIKNKGVICDRCGVEVTQAKVRRERMGHIELAVPVSHIWFFKTMPSRIGNILGLGSRALERVLYYEDYIVLDPGKTDLERKQLLSDMEYREAVEQFGHDTFRADMGASAIKELLDSEPLDEVVADLRDKMSKTKSRQVRKKLSKRLKIVDGLRSSDSNPEDMVLSIIPVIPPDLRPLVPLEGGRFATSDLNDLYRRIINRNNRLKSILQLKTPDVIVRNEKRMLQEAVDALLDNGRHGRAVLGSGNRPLKSLSEMLKGKQGRFRQNLLGKRVDYSGRAVIVVGPELKLHQCGLPKQMALELFEPFIIRELKKTGLVHTIRSAKKMIEKQTPEIWDILERIASNHTVMLNRAPTLHRLGIQAFEPMLIEGKALKLHPLVCTAFNADFDGDQMAVHVPLSVEAQLESRLLMLSINNIFTPASGKPIATPTQDIALGCYYLTQVEKEIIDDSGLTVYGSRDEVIFAFREEWIKKHDYIKLCLEDGTIITTTVGRVIFNEIIPQEIGFVNAVVDKRKLSDIISDIYKKIGHDGVVDILDRLKKLGFYEATICGASMGVDDMIIPESKTTILDEAKKEVAIVDSQYREGSITDGERYNKIVDIWTHATDTISEVMFKGLKYDTEGKLNPVFMMVDSGARGSKQQIRQLAGMRGLMAKPSGEIIEAPITSNFKEGLTVLEYFISTHGARKGLADTALKTADSGYLTRRLVDVAQDVIVSEDDCMTLNGIVAEGVYEGEEEIVSLEERIAGRVSAQDIANPATGEIVISAGEFLEEAHVALINKMNIKEVKIRSVLTCESEQGICAKCYGRNLANGKMVELGAAVGIVAAQSIGEPGTQLTMRTFHVGGTASQVFKEPKVKARNTGILKYDPDMKCVKLEDGTHVALNKDNYLYVIDKETGQELEKHSVFIGANIKIAPNQEVKKGKVFMEWDPYNIPILAEKGGMVKFVDIEEGKTVKKEIDPATGMAETVVIEHKEDKHPQIVIYALDENGKQGDEVIGYYTIPTDAHIVVEEGEIMKSGELLAKTPRKVSKTKDITGGLPRVAELFEARKPKDAAEISKIDGIVEFGGVVRNKRQVIVRDPQTNIEEEHMIPFGKHLTVVKGDRVKKGQQLTEGPVIPHEILQVCGPKDLQEYLVEQVQEVYRLQGVQINDKHIEIIIRQMLCKVKITDTGDTSFLFNEQVDKKAFNKENQAVVAKGGKPAQAAPVLLGITKASLSTESFISAASFQETTRILTDAAASGKSDDLKGFKENVIMGHVIPAGTGYKTNRKIKVVPKDVAVIGDDMMSIEPFATEEVEETEDNE